ncbi:hypothetical protein GPJ56_003413 [Histomonas meleagridis]|uniref:uncharacterized protein n=1 Tax=Histomonas meleagridis TaxID=135588 RepID=UPI00355A42A5|nr:hypothetical protein GPJ56_003413 [Histomonas meleagridis]KAH0799104.1 hypothetical protein GO595_007901 [Histomonas meleagridis]
MEGRKTLYVRISKDRFATIEFMAPPGDWFTDAHLQEILVAFADSFYDIYSLTTPLIIRTPRSTFSISVFSKSYRQYVFKPLNESEMETYSSIPKTFFIRVLGRSDVAEKIAGQATLDSAMRIIPNG